MPSSVGDELSADFLQEFQTFEPSVCPMLDTRIKRARIKYWRQGETNIPQNFGDFLSEIIADRIVTGPLIHADSYRIIGSCIASFLVADDLAAASVKDGTIAFWGCGMRDEVPLTSEARRASRFFGVRGPLTRDALGLPDDTALGDTGLLMPLVHSARRDARSAGRSICVPHICETKSESDLLELSGADLVVQPGIAASVEAAFELIDCIASADFVLCGALHAAVLAHAYRVPFAFLDTAKVDIPFKWRDFASSVAIPTLFTRNVREGKDAYASLIRPAERRLPLVPILAASPFAIRPEILQMAMKHDEGWRGNGGLHADGDRGPLNAGRTRSKAPPVDKEASQQTLQTLDAVGRRARFLETLAEEHLSERIRATAALANAETARRALEQRLEETEAALRTSGSLRDVQAALEHLTAATEASKGRFEHELGELKAELRGSDSRRDVQVALERLTSATEASKGSFEHELGQLKAELRDVREATARGVAALSDAEALHRAETSRLEEAHAAKLQSATEALKISFEHELGQLKAELRDVREATARGVAALSDAEALHRAETSRLEEAHAAKLQSATEALEGGFEHELGQLKAELLGVREATAHGVAALSDAEALHRAETSRLEAAHAAKLKDATGALKGGFKNELRKLKTELRDVRETAARDVAALSEAEALQRAEIARLEEAHAGKVKAADARISSDQGYIQALRHRLALVGHRMRAFSEIANARQAVAETPLDDVLPRAIPEREASPWPKLASSDAKSVRAFLREWNLFSPDWYRATYPDAQALDDEAARDHFLAEGIRRGRDPHPLFCTAWLLQNMAPNIAGPPIIAFMKGLVASDPHPLFDGDFYLQRSPDVRSAGTRPFRHYLQHGADENRQPHPAFEPDYYNAQRGAPPGTDLLADYVKSPSSFKFSPNPFFDGAGYVDSLPGLVGARLNPLVHYLVCGERAGRSPSPLFQPAYYLARYSDVRRSGVAAMVHFLKHGDREQRRPNPLFDPPFYADRAKDLPGVLEGPLRHYLAVGAERGIAPSPALDGLALGEAAPDLDPAQQNPLVVLLEARDLSIEVEHPGPTPSDLPASTPSSRRFGDDFWLPDRLREYVQPRYGDKVTARLHGLMEVIADWETPFGSDALSRHLPGLTARLSRALPPYEPSDWVDVSIVLPVHNQLAYTITCLLFLLENAPRCSFEVLIGDDASTDATPDVLAELGDRVRLIRHEQNLGFLVNCNTVAALARGRFIVFLNNDTLPLPGWLDALVAAADRDPSIGFVGSKLINGDGTLQEAGGLIWSDGSAWNFGRGGDPNAPAYNYLKDVDYASGAAILVPRAVWRALDGFDTTFAPAYCEDSDFAFRSRAAGYRTVYQPFSEVIHHEGRSHGRDETQGLKSYQVVNNRTLLERWGPTMLRENAPHGQEVFVARDRSRNRPHILVVDHYVPQWDRDAGSRTMLHFLRAFIGRGFHIVFWPDNLNQDPVYTRPLQELGVEVIYGIEFLNGFKDWFRERAAWLPYVLLSRPHIAVNYIDVIRDSSDSTILYYGHDLHWRRMMEEHALTGDPAMEASIATMRRLEGRLAEQSDVVIYPSEQEREIVSAQFGGRKHVLAVPAWFFERDRLASARADAEAILVRDPKLLLFVGGFAHDPNRDAVTWFVTEVLPILRRREPGFRLKVAGSNAPQAILDLAGDDVEFVGQVSDDELASLYASAGAAIVPLRFGGGVKGKVIEAFAKAVPVVSTPVGMQGIPEPETVAFVAETADGFVEQVTLAARDRSLALRRALAALDFVEQHYTDAKFLDQLAPMMPELRRKEVA